MLTDGRGEIQLAIARHHTRQQDGNEEDHDPVERVVAAHAEEGTLVALRRDDVDAEAEQVG